jgi:hypothetical protein
MQRMPRELALDDVKSSQQNQSPTFLGTPKFSRPPTTNQVVGSSYLSGRAIFTYRDNVLPRFSCPTRRRNQVVAGELWYSLSAILERHARRAQPPAKRVLQIVNPNSAKVIGRSFSGSLLPLVSGANTRVLPRGHVHARPL